MSHLTYFDLLHINRSRNLTTDDRLGAPPLPLLVTGITGVAGYNALAYFQSCFPGRVFGIVPPGTVGFQAPDTIVCPMEESDQLERLFEQHRFQSVLDCAGNCALKACQLEPQIAWTLNVSIVENLARITKAAGIRLVHLSVDMVFGGRPGGGYREEEAPTPVNVYGQTMVAGEEVLTGEDPFAVTLRISMPMGVSFNGHAGAIDWISARFKQKRPATLYYDEVRSPTYTDCLNRVFRAFLANDYSGLLHCGGPRPVSLYQMAQIINRAGGFKPELLYGMMKDESCPVPPRVSDCSLDSTRLTEYLGFTPFHPWPATDQWMPDNRQWHYRRPTPGSVSEMIELLAFCCD